MAMALSSLVLMLGLATDAAAQTTCAATDAAITGVTPAPPDPAALAGDCTTLLGLMDTLRGTAPLNWDTTLSMTSWHGILVIGSRVTRLDLSYRQLTGTIPAALNRLTSLERLLLYGNQLTGSIPDLSGLTSLERLWLSQNQLTGSIPDLSSLTSLRELVLSYSELSGEIPELSDLTRLEVLQLSYNKLSGEIPDLSSLTELRELLLIVNELSGEIPDLSALTRLEALFLSQNELSGSIPDLSVLTNLQQIELYQNQLSGSIPDLSALTNLRQLHLYQNQLSGSIPDLSSLTNLTNLQLHQNQLSGSIPDLSALTDLIFLFLHGNQLTGSIPDLSSLTSLKYLRLDNNQLTGSIDASFFPNSLLWFLLHRNRLNGAIPDLSALTSLQFLLLHQNQLSGPLPTWWASLPALQWVYLAGNPLTGGIPSQLGSLASLARLSLCGTNLDASATLPAALETRRTGGQLTVWSCLSIEDASATEGSALDFAVEHSTYPVRGVAGATGGLTLSYETADGTASSADYSGTAEGSVTIPANTDSDDATSSAAISVPTTADALADDGETLTVTLLSGWPASGVVPLRRTATGTILDYVGPPLPTVSFSSANYTLIEQEGGGNVGGFTVRLSEIRDEDTVVGLTFTNETADDDDYASANLPASVTIDAGFISLSYPIHALEDSKDEPDETFTIEISSVSNWVRKGRPSLTRMTIKDNDGPTTPVASFATALSSAVESAGPRNIRVNFNPATQSAITLGYGVGGPATPGSDYTALSGSVSVSSGASSVDIAVAIIDDTVEENSETVVLTLTGGSGYTVGSPNRHTLTITDDDGTTLPVASFASSSSSASESAGTRNVTVNLSPAQTTATTVSYTVGGNATEGSDYSISGSGSLSVSPGATTATIAVAITDDTAEENSETVVLTLTGGSGYTVGSPNHHTLTIADNDGTTPPVASFATALSSAVESAGTRNIQVNLNPAPQSAITLGYGGGGTATEGSDYTALSGSVAVSSGASSVDIAVAIIDDTAEENSETVVLTLTEGSGYTLGSPNRHTLTITDDDGTTPPPTPSVSLSASPNPVAEGSTVTLTARLSEALSNSVTIPLTLTAGTAERDDFSSLASITVGSGNLTGTGTVTTAQDADEDDETFTVALGSLPSGVTAGSPSSVQVTITDDDGTTPPPATPTVSLSATPNPVTEGSTVTLTARLSEALSNSVTIPLTLTAGTAERDDFSSLASITVGGGNLTGTGTVTTAQDADEDDETFTVALGSLPSDVTPGSPSSVQVTIRDGDEPPPDEDEDEDGFPDRIESCAANNGDGNGDGVPDAEQSHVVSFPNAKDGRCITLEVPRQTRLSGVRSLRRLPRGYSPLPPEVTAPICYLGFYLGRVGRGGDVTVSLYLPGRLEVNRYWQYGPTADQGEPHWQPFANDGESGATIPAAGRIDLHYIDGGRGDGDGRRNGVIESFGAPLLVVPALAPVSLALPGEEEAVGVALHNPTRADNAVVMSVVDAGGETHRQVELGEALEGKGQLARMVCELIDCELESGAAAVVVARGRQGHLRSMFMVGTRDGRKLDGVSGEFEAARRLLFPLVQSEGDRATLLFVFNPSLMETGVTFARYRKEGSLSASASRTVAAGGFVMETAAGLFGSADEGEPGYVEARAGRSLLGFAFLRDEESFAALAAQTPQQFPADESLHAPHFEMGAESRTTLYVLSDLAAHTTRLRVRAFDEDGHPVGEAERELSRAAGSLLLVSDLGALLQLPPSDGLIEGYLKLDFSVTAGALLHFARPRVLGAVEVVRGGNRTVLPVVGPGDIPTRSFLQVAHSDRPDSHMFTSLAVLNPGPQTALVTLRVYDPAGRPSAPDRIVSIVPGRRLSGSLEAEWLLDPPFTQVGGHLQVISDRPVISFVLFSGRNGQYLSAIAARPASP